MDYNSNIDIRQLLFSLKDEKYKSFSAPFIPTVNKNNIIGVRVPILRKLAKKIATCPTQYFANKQLFYQEEIILYGFVIGYYKTDILAKLKLFDDFLNYANSWLIIDCCICGVADFKKEENSDIVFEYFKQKTLSKQEYVCRAGIVGLFSYFLTDKYIQKVVEIYSNISSEKYYINMALAWAVTEILTKYFSIGYSLLESQKLSDFVFNMAIKKANESYRITKQQKEQLNLLKTSIKEQ